MTETGAIESITAGNRRRPGPFGPAWALLPKDQKVETIRREQLAHEALDRMIDQGFSQMPVADADGVIVGVFSHKGFSRRCLDLMTSAKIDPLQLPVHEFIETAQFITPDTYIDTATDWGEIDYVLVGDPRDVLGILTIADVWGRLNDFAEAFVLLYEIEHELRDLIQDVVSDDDLSGLIENMNLPTNARIPQALVDFTFAQYRGLICDKSNWPRFEEVFGRPRDLVNADLGTINDLRNTVFHFRRGITNTDTDRLRRFRDKLRHNRDIWHRRRGLDHCEAGSQ